MVLRVLETSFACEEAFFAVSRKHVVREREGHPGLCNPCVGFIMAHCNAAGQNIFWSGDYHLGAGGGAPGVVILPTLLSSALVCMVAWIWQMATGTRSHQRWQPFLSPHCRLTMSCVRYGASYWYYFTDGAAAKWAFYCGLCFTGHISHGHMVLLLDTWRYGDMVILSYGDMVPGVSNGQTPTQLHSHDHMVTWAYGAMMTWWHGPRGPTPTLLHSSHMVLSGSKKCLLSAGDSESWRHTRNAWNGCKEPRTGDKLLETVGGADDCKHPLWRI